MAALFGRWARAALTETHRRMQQSVALGVRGHLEDVRAELELEGAAAVGAAAVQAVVARNRELVALRDEQQRLIDEYQQQLLQQRGREPSFGRQLARRFLQSREREVARARAHAGALGEELDRLVALLGHAPAVEAAAPVPGARSSSMTRERALRVVLSELRRVQAEQASSSEQIRVLKHQLALQTRDVVNQRRAIHFLEFENSRLQPS